MADAGGPAEAAPGAQAGTVDENSRMVTLVRQQGSPFGFSIVGGVSIGEGANTIQAPLVVSKVTAGSPADAAGLHVGMLLLEVAGTDVRSAAHDQAVTLLKMATGDLQLLLSTPKIQIQASAAGGNAYVPGRQVETELILPVAYERVEMLFAFKGTRDDELTVAKGDILHVTGKGTDGWVMAVCQRTGKRGMVPGNFAKKLRHLPEALESLYDSIEDYQRPPSSSGERVYEELPAGDTNGKAEGDTASSVFDGSRPPSTPVSPVVEEAGLRKASDTIRAFEAQLPASLVVEHEQGSGKVMLRPRDGSSQAELDGLYAQLNKRSTSVSSQPPEVEDLYACVTKVTATAPQIPERRYDKDLLPPTVGVQLSPPSPSVSVSDPNYEVLPVLKSHNDQGESDGEETYATLPFQTGAAAAPPPAIKVEPPPLPPTQKRASSGAVTVPKTTAATPGRPTKEEKKELKREKKRREKELKAERKRLAKEEKEAKKLEKRRRSSPNKAKDRGPEKTTQL